MRKELSLKSLKRFLASFYRLNIRIKYKERHKSVFKQDFDSSVDVIPVSDPNIFSMTQRITCSHKVNYRWRKSAPELHNLRESYRKMYLALNIQDIDSILPPEERKHIPPRDPIQ